MDDKTLAEVLRALSPRAQALLKVNEYGFSKKHMMWGDTVEKALLALADELEGKKNK